MVDQVLKEVEDEVLNETTEDLVGQVLKEVENEVLDETTKDLVGQVLKEVKDEVLDETTEDLVDQVLKDVEDEVLDETTEDLVGQVLKEVEGKVLDETTKGLVGQVLKDAKDNFLDGPMKNFDCKDVESERIMNTGKVFIEDAQDKDRNLAIQALREVEDKSPNGIAMDLERNLPVISSDTEDTEDKQEEVLTQVRYFFFFCAHVESFTGRTILANRL